MYLKCRQLLMLVKLSDLTACYHDIKSIDLLAFANKLHLFFNKSSI